MSRHDDPNLLREPTRPMPDSLRSRLLAIPGDSTALAESDESDELDRLYDAALAAQSQHDVESMLDEDSLQTTPLRAAIVRLLAAVFRDARAVRPMPERLAGGLRAVRKTAGRRQRSTRKNRWQTRWITEPRWAAAACWLLAFALTLGTGESVAGLLDAPTKLHAQSSSWIQRAGVALGDAWDGARPTVQEPLALKPLVRSDLWLDVAETAGSRLDNALGFVRARSEALGVQFEASADRLVHEVSAAWSVVRADLIPQIENTVSTTPVSTSHSNPTNPGDPSPEEARDDR